MNTRNGVPAGCHPPSEQTWWESIINLFPWGHSDECQKYSEAVMLDPLLEVTPTLVLSEMVAGFFLHPAGMLGSAVADYSKNVLGMMYFLLYHNEITMFCFVIALFTQWQNTFVKVRNINKCMSLFMDVRYYCILFWPFSTLIWLVNFLGCRFPCLVSFCNWSCISLSCLKYGYNIQLLKCYVW